MHIIIIILSSLQLLAIVSITIGMHRHKGSIQTRMSDFSLTQDGLQQKIQSHSLHLKRIEDQIRAIELDRLAPLAKNFVTLHKDHEELLNFLSRSHFDQTFGSNFSKQRKA